MKAWLTINLCFILPLMLFFTYIILVIVGCVACSCGATESFFCNTYSNISTILLLGVTGLFFSYLIVGCIKKKKM